MKRRDMIRVSALALASVPLLRPRWVRAADPAAQAFDYAWLKGHARDLASRPYAPRAPHFPLALANLSWDKFQSIRFRPEHALWVNDRLRFRIEFFHPGMRFGQPVRMHVVSGAKAREIQFDSSMFDFSQSGLKPSDLGGDLGFAGFRINFHTDFTRNVTAFLGASYFRAVGETLQYGLSARGLAVDCGMNRPEEFPAFTAFWIEQPAPDASALTVYALLESPSVTGAYRFEIEPGANQIMRIDAALYPRKPIERLGIAPLTSMFLCAANDHRVADDWRPAIHDSDGLAMWNGNGEWLWRPLTNPSGVRFNAFQDHNPRGFGLLQRDRNFDHYEDDGVFYDRRPSLWVEPISGFEKGSVDLLEIPAGDETADNIVAFWCPEQAPTPGHELLFAYRLHWGDRPPLNPPFAQTAMTWTGIGGVVGRPRDHSSWRFVVDFSGGDFAMLSPDAKIEPIVTASQGNLELISVRPLASVHGYRAMFDLRPGNATGQIDLRLFLRLNGQPLSETWLYQWSPPVHPPT